MVVYRGSNGLKYKRYTGNNWQEVADVNGTTGASRNPSLVYKSNSYCYYNLTWDNGSDVYHQQFYGSSWSSPSEVSTTWTNGNQYSSYALTGNLDRHIVWQASDWIGGQTRQVIMHNKNLNPTVFSEFIDYRDYLRPTGSGHSGGAFTVLWHDLWDAKNIRKARYNGSSWEQGQFGAVIATNGMNASLSVTNPPGALAKAIWSSAGSSPSTLTVGPSDGLNKKAEEETVYHRRIIFYQEDKNALALQLSEMQLTAASGCFHIAFPEVNDNDHLTPQQALTSLTVAGINIPKDADSLVLHATIYSKNLSAVMADASSAMDVTLSLTDSKKDEQLFPLSTLTGDTETRLTLRASLPLQPFRGRSVTLRPKLANLAIEKCQAALVHVYLNNAQALFRGVASQPLAKAEEAIVKEASLRIHPNPFNPGTHISYYLPQEAQVEVAIYNILGQKLVTLEHGLKPAGEHSLLWDGRNSEAVKLGAGVYFCKMRIGNWLKTEKMTLLP